IYERSIKIIGTTLLIYALLVASHLGEFWPFSIYPMFSQAAKPWTRSLVTEVSSTEDQNIWAITDIDQLSGKPFALNVHHIDQIDLSNYVSKTDHWDSARLQGLRTMFGERLIAHNDLMINKVNGLIHDDNRITMETIPFILLTADSTYLNPGLPQDFYFKDH
ncbi:MAG: hypothetical protein WED82_01725, partial [Balneolales bacterium]